jgi:hypothetical protein
LKVMLAIAPEQDRGDDLPFYKMAGAAPCGLFEWHANGTTSHCGSDC